MSRLWRVNAVSVAVMVGLCSQAAVAQQVAVTDEEDVLVVGVQQESAVGPDFSYLGARSLTATKTDMALNETPRAISVVTREQLDDRASISISDALQYTPSIQSNYYGEDNKQDWFVVRGFQQAGNGLYLDSTRLYSSGFYSWQIDPFALERVEILRGPASVLYGQNPPGGVINLVSKRAQFDGDSGQVSLQGGSYDRLQASADINTEISDNVAFRLVMLARENGTRVDDVEAKRWLIAPSLAWQVSDATEVVFLASYQNDDSDPYLQFLPMEGTLTDNPNGKINDSTAIGNPDWETFEREQLSLGYELSHQFNNQLSFAQSARYSQMDITLRQIYSLGYAADHPQFGPLLDPTGQRQTVLRGVSTEEGDSTAFNIDNRLVLTFDTGSVGHTFLAGIDYQQIDITSRDYAADPLVADGDTLLPTPFGFSIPNPTFNVFNPSYSNNVVLLDPNTLQPVTDADLQTTKIENRQLGFYLQDQVRIGERWVLQAGVRYDDTSNERRNSTTGDAWTAEYEEWTTSAGLAYVSAQGFTPYISYAQSFEPIITTQTADQPSEPERGESVEVGVKYQPARFDGYFNVAAYDMTKENLGQLVGNEFVQIGEVTNRGLEFEAVANITPALTVIGNLALVDSEITANSNAALVGKRPAQIADSLASAWATYRFFGGALDGLSIGGGVRYTGDTYGDNLEMNQVPSYTLYDATISYRMDNYKVQLVAKNLLDEEYVATCNYYCWYGDRQNVMLNVSYDWW
uniref:TonB-dependent siderophore receptor n=1 Tax=Thaumasiovibrio occultus TaxID=1891184 RepID=UPI000B363D54|nr:TonB-dependent siderophore receptor [Thaumasiovibrio occultus]